MRIFGGVAAKTTRAIEHLEVLHAELREFREMPRPYCFIMTVDSANGHHSFRLHPSWDLDTASMWAVIVGEIVHNLRSALDHLIWECVRLSDGTLGNHTAFPLLRSEPEEGFAAVTTRAPTPRLRRPGKLFGLRADAVSLVETFQPYHGTRAGRLMGKIDSLWQTDKHQMPLPLLLLGREPTIEVEDCVLLDSSVRTEKGTLLVDAWVSATGPAPSVDVKADAPFDLAFDGSLVVDDLSDAALILIQMRGSFEELFPDEEDLELRKQREAFDASLRQSRESRAAGES